MPTREKVKFWVVTVLLMAVLVGAVVGVCTLGAPLGQAVGPRDFTVRHRSGLVDLAGAQDDERLATLCAWAEGFTKRLAARYGVAPPSVSIRLLPDKRAFEAYGSRYLPGWRRGIDFCYSRREQVIYGYVGNTDRVKTRLRHEIMHRIVHLRLPRLPLWLDEGLAELAEGFRPLDEDPEALTLDAVQPERLRVAAVLVGDEDLNPGKLAATDGKHFAGQHLKSWYSLAYAVVLCLERQARLRQVLDAGEAVLAAGDYGSFVADPDLWLSDQLAVSGTDPAWHLPTVR